MWLFLLRHCKITQQLLKNVLNVSYMTLIHKSEKKIISLKRNCSRFVISPKRFRKTKILFNDASRDSYDSLIDYSHLKSFSEKQSFTFYLAIISYPNFSSIRKELFGSPVRIKSTASCTPNYSFACTILCLFPLYARSK